jgi:hypothetical protein
MKRWIVLAALCACNCHFQPEPETPKPERDDSGATLTLEEACAVAAANELAMGCRIDEPLPGPDGEVGTEDDRTFAQVCVELESDIPGSIDPECIVAATTCEAAKACAPTNE